MTALISARGLHKTYDAAGRQTVALDGLDLDVAPGEFVAVMGPSASGKSTLLNLLAGLDTPTAGEVHLDGERIDHLSEAQRAILRRDRVGFVFQLFNLARTFTITENIELPALVAGRTAGQARDRAEELMDRLDLTDKAHDLPSDLSGGEQQRAALARALVNAPALLLADEPTGNLDTDNARDVIRLLSEYHDEGQTIVLVTHDARVAASAQRIAHLRDGRVRDETRLGAADDPRAVLSKLVDLEM